MNKSMYISEFGVFQKSTINKQSSSDSLLLDRANWNTLEEIVLNSNSKIFSYLNSPNRIRVNSYIGVISLNNIHVEVLPKTSRNDKVDLIQNRKRLLKMISRVYNLNLFQSTNANLQLSNKPLIEVLIERYLKLLAGVIKKGVAREYKNVYGFEKFIKGKLLLSKQLRMPKPQMNRAHIEFDELSFDRPENRLIKSTLEVLRKRSLAQGNSNLVEKLNIMLNEVPISSSIKNDLNSWRTSRDMLHYQALLPFIKFILYEQSPETIKGEHRGISFLFQMEELFEKYVYEVLKSTYKEPYKLKKQISSMYIARQGERNMFSLKPDIALFKDGNCISILDTKWKLLDQNNEFSESIYNSNYGMKQADIYQLFTYGEKYLHGKGEMYLIYPATSKFNKPLEPLILNQKGLKLNILPFNLDTDEVLIN